MGRLFYAVNTYAKLYYPFIGKTLTQYIAMCYHKFNEETTVINLTLRPTVNPLPVPNRNAVDLSGSLYMGEYFMLSMHLRQQAAAQLPFTLEACTAQGSAATSQCERMESRSVW